MLPILAQILRQLPAIADWIWRQGGNGQTEWQRPTSYHLRNGQMSQDQVDQRLVRKDAKHRALIGCGALRH